MSGREATKTFATIAGGNFKEDTFKRNFSEFIDYYENVTSLDKCEYKFGFRE